jgi:hypothetical protein
VESVHPTPSHRDHAWQWLGLAAWLAVTVAAAALGAMASVNAGEFYQQLALNALWSWL